MAREREKPNPEGAEEKPLLRATLVQDEPWTFLDARGNPVVGRRLTFLLEDGTRIELDVTLQEYQNPARVREKLNALIRAHQDLREL